MGKDYKLLLGNAEKVLSQLEDKSIQCVITSPPYYGLRDYGTGQWIGGDPNCPHYRTTKYSPNCDTGHKHMGEIGEAVGDAIYKKVCPLCGAVRVDEQIGLEETPEEYVDRLVGVFREVKRVLKDDGTLWVNIGDSYVSKVSANHNNINKRANSEFIAERTFSDEYKEKDLIGIPWMLAFALRKDGWYLRQDIIWHKLNNMPEPVKDRCVKSHEYIFLLSKKPHYKFNYEAIQEECISDSYIYTNDFADSKESLFDLEDSIEMRNEVDYNNSKYVGEEQESSVRCGMNKNRGNNIILKRYNLPSQDEFVDFIRSSEFSAEDLSNKCNIQKTTIEHWYRKDEGGSLPSIEDWKVVREFLSNVNNFEIIDNKLLDITEETDDIGKNNTNCMKNKRDVWSVSTKPFKEAHFATYPEKLIEPCVLAGSDKGDVILDPFNGSGTTGAVALRYDRKYVGIDLNSDYLDIAIRRLNNVELEKSKIDLW